MATKQEKFFCRYYYIFEIQLILVIILERSCCTSLEGWLNVKETLHRNHFLALLLLNIYSDNSLKNWKVYKMKKDWETFIRIIILKIIPWQNPSFHVSMQISSSHPASVDVMNWQAELIIAIFCEISNTVTTKFIIAWFVDVKQYL